MAMLWLLLELLTLLGDGVLLLRLKCFLGQAGGLDEVVSHVELLLGALKLGGCGR